MKRRWRYTETRQGSQPAVKPEGNSKNNRMREKKLERIFKNLKRNLIKVVRFLVQGNTDTVPAMLTPGEFVLTKDAVNQVGADTLYGMNAAAGGVGKPSQQKPAKKKKMKTSTVGTMMNLGGLKMGGMTNNMSYAGGGQVPVQN